MLFHQPEAEMDFRGVNGSYLPVLLVVTSRVPYFLIS